MLRVGHLTSFLHHNVYSALVTCLRRLLGRLERFLVDSDRRGLCRGRRLTLLLRFDVFRAGNTEPLPPGFLL